MFTIELLHKMRNSSVVLLLLLNLHLIYGQQAEIKDCQPIFNPQLMNFEGENSLSNSSINFNASSEYLASLDTVEFYEGLRSLKVTGTNSSSNTFATASFEVPLEVKKGATIQLSARVKTDSLRGENGGALIRLLGYSAKNTSAPALFKFNENVVGGNTKWTRIFIESTIEEDLNHLVLSGLVQGQGTAWFDDFVLRINDVPLNIGDFQNLKKHRKSIEKEIVQYIAPFEPSDYPVMDSELSKSRLIGLGEATHGTKQIFELKKNLIAYLIANHNVRKIALEAYYQNTEVLNDYIQTGEGDAKEILAYLEFWPYYTEEFLDFVEWLKDYNRTHSEKVSIVGIDAQSAEQSLIFLKDKLEDKNDLSLLLTELGKDTIPLTRKLKLSNELLASLSESNTTEKIKRNAEILSQSYYLSQFSGLEYSRIRDSIMALNTEYLVKTLSKNEKAVLWAHDLHVQKKEGWTGRFLAEDLGQAYLNVGFLLDSGTFTALEKSSRELNSQNTLNPVTCNSIESILTGFHSPIQILDMKDAAKSSMLNHHFLNENIYKRSIGALDRNVQFESLGESPGETFDYLIYIKSSEGSHILSTKIN